VYVFLDFEASSLAKASYPIEVAWVFENGRSETHLIRPALAWTDWDTRAEAIHGIPRAKLELGGEPIDRLANHLLSILTGHLVHASSPSRDGKWLSLLLRTAGLPRHALRLRDTDAAQLDAANAQLAAILPNDVDRAVVVEHLIAEARLAAEGPVAHRALPDAQHELTLWQDITRRAKLEAQRRLAERSS
jgi:hypothetical protein